MRKIYFYDLGIRNALIDNFKPLIIINNEGALFENFIISKILKKIIMMVFGYQLYFWRSKQIQKVNLVLQKRKELLEV